MARKSAHRKALERIAACPHEVGIENVFASAIEPNLYNNNGSLVAQPDIVFYCRDKGNIEIHLIEFKSNGDEIRAQQQLYRAVQWFNKYLSISPKTRIIEGSFFRKRHKNPIKRDYTNPHQNGCH